MPGGLCFGFRCSIGRPSVKKLVLVALCLLVASCADLQRFAMTPQEREQHDLNSCSANDNKTWDLGTGRAIDTRETAKGFFALRAPGWTRPMPLYVPRSENERKVLDKKNHRRLQALEQVAGSDFKLEPVKVDDVEVEDIVPTAPHPGTAVHFIPIGSKAGALLVTPGKCPHLVAKDTCQNEKLHTTLKVDGTVSCLGPYSVSDDYVDVSVNNGASQPLKFGEPRLFKVTRAYSSAPTITVEMSLPHHDKPFWKGQVQLGDFKGATPDEVLSLLSIGYLERAAAAAYHEVPDQWKTPEFKKQVVERRVEGAKKVIAKATTTEKVMALVKVHAINAGLPGDEQVSALIKPKLKEVLHQIAENGEPTKHDYELGTVLMMGFRRWDPSIDLTEESKAFEQHYGPAISSGTIGDAQDRSMFLSLFPKSTYSEAIRKQQAQARAKAEKDAAEKQKEADADAAWDDVESPADQIAQNRYRASFIRKYVPMSWRTRRGLKAMELYTKGMIDQNFCPAKKAFLKLAGAAEYQRRAKAHCTDEPPTGSGINGVEVVLTSQCKTAFATPCP